MSFSVRVEQPGVTLIDSTDYSWSWDEAEQKFRHEQNHELKSLEEILRSVGPCTFAFQDITLAMYENG